LTRYFRIAKQNPPTLDDFKSHKALGLMRRRHLTERQSDLWAGISVYLSIDAALLLLSQSPRLGNYVADIEIQEGLGVRIEQSGRNQQHMTVWAEPDYLLGKVVSTNLASAKLDP
jgi:hypothetical protein